MATVRKFTFDLDFDAPASPERAMPAAAAADVPVVDEPAPEAEPAPEPAPGEEQGPALAYSEDDLEIAREEAYIAGHTAALEAATTASEQALAEATEKVGAGLAALGPEIARTTEEVSSLAGRVAVEVVRKLLPHTADDYAAREVEALVRGLLPSLTGQPRLIVRVHPRMADVLRPRLLELADRAGFEGKVVVIEGDGMTPSDASVEWAEGGAERNTSRLWEAVDALLDANIPRFSRAEALEVPAAEEPDPAPTPEDIWPEIDASAWYTPPPGPAAAPVSAPVPAEDTDARSGDRVPEE